MYALIEFGCRGTERANFSVPSDERLSASLLDIFSALEEWETDKIAEITKGRFGFHRGGIRHEPPTAAYIQIYVKSSALSRTPILQFQHT
jgi:hypothetical protein